MNIGTVPVKAEVKSGIYQVSFSGMLPRYTVDSGLFSVTVTGSRFTILGVEHDSRKNAATSGQHSINLCFIFIFLPADHLFFSRILLQNQHNDFRTRVR